MSGIVGDPAPVPYHRTAGGSIVVGLLADKWTIPVLRSLARGTKRTGELKKELSGVSQKMLSQTLRSLVEHGLVARRAYPVVPPKVEYSLTALGVSMNEPLTQMCQWTERHRDALRRARETQQSRKKKPSVDRALAGVGVELSRPDARNR
jgi:DNA-binding HxlR family transcriptional regulator